MDSSRSIARFAFHHLAFTFLALASSGTFGCGLLTELPMFSHVISMQADAPGKLTIEVRGNHLTSSGEYSLGTVERFVTVY